MMRALSVSGGGIRGIIPILALQALEQQTGKLVRDVFQFVAGCSTGSAITALIAAGVPMETALTFYTGPTAKKVFSPASALIADPKRLIDGWIYDPKNLAKALRTALGSASNWTMDQCPIRCLIITVDTTGKSWFFVQSNPKNSKLTGPCSLVECTVASCCAPTYFDFFPVEVGDQWINMADGGTAGFANPVAIMAREMFKYDHLFEPVNTQIVSLGTGQYVAPSAPPIPKGLIATIGFATNTLVNASEALAFDDVADLYPQASVTALNPALPSDIDEADLSAVPALVKIGQEAAAKIDWSNILK